MRHIHFPRLSAIAALILGFILLLPAARASASDATDLLALVNRHRAANGLGPLCLNAQLNDAAFAHSQDMLRNNYFSHTGLNGSRPGDRIQATGYRGTFFSENIAQGYRTPAEVFEGWRTSPGHNANMLSASVTEMGIGRAGDYWTQVFSNGQPCNPTVLSGIGQPNAAPTQTTSSGGVRGVGSLVAAAPPVRPAPITTVVPPAPPAPVVVAQPPAPAAPPAAPPPAPQNAGQPVVQQEVTWMQEAGYTESQWSWQDVPQGYTCTTEIYVDAYGITWECTVCYSY